MTNKILARWAIIILFPAFSGASAVEPFDTSQTGLSTSELSRRTLLNYIGPILRSSGKAGRLYYSDRCEGTAIQSVPFPVLKLQRGPRSAKGVGAVRGVLHDQRNARIAEKDGVVEINIGTVRHELLDTKISTIRFKPDEQYTAALAVDSILGAKEIKAVAAKLGFQQPVRTYGLNVQEPSPGLPHLPRSLRDMTLDQALDTVARTFGALVTYGECTDRDGIHLFQADAIELAGLQAWR